MTTYTYRFKTHWTTTDEELTGYIDRFVVPPEDIQRIEDGELPDEVLQIEDPVQEEPAPEVIE